MSHHTESLFVFMSTVAGGAASSLAVIWAVYTHKKSEMDKKRLEDAKTSRTLANLQTENQIHKIVSDAVTAATAPLQVSINENTKITQSIDLRLTRVETVQFGGNGGGFREELNNNSAMTKKVVEELATLKDEITTLKVTRKP